MMGNIYDNLLQFKGIWRDYQDRVLANSQKYLADRKLHIVAAPGSGKTTLGIELIRRLGAPCLILSPSITIRQQWLERITEGFLADGCSPETILSNDLKNMKMITAVTYQALYSAVKHYEGALEDQDESGGESTGDPETSETVDFRDFDLFKAVKESGIQTICLDEAHHLRSEWWKALEAFMKEMEGAAVIALTATPPYDSTPNQWKRYIDLCGPIDEEISTPELVREGSLCPHEDYVYFNWPAGDELREIEEYQKKTAKVRDELLADREFARMVASHKGLADPEGYSEKFLDDPKYFSALLIFCQAQGIPFSPYLKELIGTRGKLPELNDEWLEVLLQGFLYDDTESYQVLEEKRTELLGKLKEAGCIYRKKVCLTHKDVMQKLLVKSKGKMESIGRIAEAEYASMGRRMRLLILCDYIKKEKLSVIGTQQEMTSEIGAVPIFEFLRRKQREGIRLGCLSGTVVIIPLDTEEKILEMLDKKKCEGNLIPIGDTGYGKLQVKGKQTHVVSAVTELFEQGEINALVGTKSLLGEGWDAPCINSLILATYVGSFMLSNQMRGRTIRTDRNDPGKTGNIWHLACIFPRKEGKKKDADFSGDYETLARRFDTFLGVSWETPVIESGIGRLGIPDFNTREEMEEINEKMLARASDREGLRRRWADAMKEIRGEMEVQQTEDIRDSEAATGYLFVHALGLEILSIILAVLSVMGRVFLEAGYLYSPGISIVLWAVTVLASAGIAKYGIRLFQFSTPERRMRRLGQAVADALAELGELEDPEHCRVEVESADGILISVWLKGGTMRDKTVFAACMEEIWGIIDNPRYLLMRKSAGRRGKEFYAVPEIFGRQKERAYTFERQIRRAMGSFQVVYTRTPEGRKTLLRARTRSFVNKNQSVLKGRKVAKGKYE